MPPFPSLTATPSPTAGPNLDAMQVRFYHPWTGEIAAEIASLMDEFNAGNEWGIHVTAEAAGSASAVNYLVDSGQLPVDEGVVLAAAPDTLLPWMARDKVIVPLNDYINAADLGLNVNDFYPAFWQQDQWKGQQAGIPAVRDAMVLIYNHTWAEKLGFEVVPADLPSMEEQLCRAASANNDDNLVPNNGTGGLLLDSSARALLPWLLSFGSQGIIEDGTVAYDQPAMRELLQTMRGWVTEGCAWVATNQWGRLSFAERQALILAVPGSELGDVEIALQAQRSEDVWSVIPYPGGDTRLAADGISYGIKHGSEEQQLAAWIFVRWLSQPEQSARLLRAQNGLPVMPSIAGEAVGSDFVQGQRSIVLEGIDEAVTPPNTLDWKVAALILQDGFWRAMLMEPPEDGYAALLAEMQSELEALGKSR